LKLGSRNFNFVLMPGRTIWEFGFIIFTLEQGN
jgi:hypothetical protein